VCMPLAHHKKKGTSGMEIKQLGSW
jgi:hypothetical protein